MARLKIETVGNGQHPTEVLIAVRTADGSKEKVVLDRRSVKDGTIDVGYPVGDEGDFVLIELPRESVRGLWRIWVPKDLLVTESVP